MLKSVCGCRNSVDEKSILEVPDAGICQYCWILEHFLWYQYYRKMWYLTFLQYASVIQKLKILEHKNGLVLANTRVPVSGTRSTLFSWRSIPTFLPGLPMCLQKFCMLQETLLTIVNKTWYNISLTGGNWQKWKRVFLTCPCHEIYRDMKQLF